MRAALVIALALMACQAGPGAARRPALPLERRLRGQRGLLQAYASASAGSAVATAGSASASASAGTPTRQQARPAITEVQHRAQNLS